MSRPDTETVQRIQIVRWISGYGQAWRDKDADAVAALFTPDATYQSDPTRAPHQGREAIRRYWTGATATQSELDLRFGEPVIDSDRAAVEWWAVMRDAAAGPERDNDWMTLPGCLLLRFMPDGRCAQLREYWNTAFGRRLAPPQAWGT
jgi:uncharacterized protein (TIGR02246 family)